METKKFLVPTWESEYKMVEQRLNKLNNSLLSLKEEGLENFMTSEVLMTILKNLKEGLKILKEAAIKFEVDRILRPSEKQAVREKWDRLFARLESELYTPLSDLNNTPFYLNIAPFIHVRNNQFLIKQEAKAAFKELRTVESQPYHEEFANLLNEFLQAEHKLKAFWESHTTDPYNPEYSYSKMKRFIEDGKVDLESIVLSRAIQAEK